jgi:hypothetical protein
MQNYNLLPPQVLAVSTPVAAETTLVTAVQPTVIRSIKVTAGAITATSFIAHYRAKGVAAAAANAFAAGTPVDGTTLELAPQGGFLMNPGDILSVIGAASPNNSFMVTGNVLGPDQ